MSETNQNVLGLSILLLALTVLLVGFGDASLHRETQALIEEKCGTPTETSLKWPPPEEAPLPVSTVESDGGT